MVDKITNPPSQKDLIDKVNELVDNKQDTLVSGTNIKTINNTSILGSGNIVIQAGADVDLSNITSTGKNIANWSTNITNCITEIPQDIKLELNNGTLTLKAGSKVYVPNGVGVFDVKNITSDYVLTQKYGTQANVVLFVKSGGGIELRNVETICSGPNDTITGVYHFWYDTTNNIIRAVESNGSYRNYTLSFPFAIVKMSGTGASVASIDQVFNGFGYIGSTVFALPGVKGLIPNGRNEDGSLKNIEFTTENVLIRTFSANIKTVTYITSGGIYVSSQRVFDFEKNAYVENGSLVYQTELTKVTTDSNGKITLFRPKLSYRAVDYSDSSWLSGLGMPSSRYIDLTLGASGASYTAPANGWIFLRFDVGSGTSFITIVNNGLIADQSICEQAHPAINKLFIVPKGEYKLYYANITPVIFRFVYAGGEA